MPGNIQNAAPSGVMPYSLCLTFSEAREYAQLQVSYHDGTIDRCQLATTSRRTFKQSKRLQASDAAALKTFWDSVGGGLKAFLFYNTAEGPYDPSGDATTGRYTVVFRGNWSQTTGVLRSDIPEIELIEVA